jgi:hypothetical protein
MPRKTVRCSIFFCLAALLLIGATLTSGCVDEVFNEIFGEPDSGYESYDSYSSSPSSSGYGWIVISSYPGGAQVTVDGQYLGTTGEYENFVVEASSGHHTVEITKPGYRAYQEYVTIYAGDTYYLDAFLTEGSVQPTYAPVYATSTPFDWGPTVGSDYECEAYERPQGIY